MLNQDLIKFIRTLSPITNTLILKHPFSAGSSVDSSIAFRFNAGILDPEAFEPIYLNNNLDEFLSIFGLFPSGYTVNVQDNLLTVRDEHTSASFILSDKDLIGAPFTIDPSRFDNLIKVPDAAIFELSSDTMKRMRQASSVFKTLESISIKTVDNAVKLSLVSKEKFSQTRSNSFDVEIPSTNRKEFEVFIRTSSFFDVPLGDYTCNVKYNSTAEMYCIVLRSKTIDGFELILSTLA